MYITYTQLSSLTNPDLHISHLNICMEVTGCFMNRQNRACSHGSYIHIFENKTPVAFSNTQKLFVIFT